MSSRGRKRKADVAFATQDNVTDGSVGSASRSLRPRLSSATVTSSPSSSSLTGSSASSSGSRASLKSNQQQQQQATKQRRSQRQIKMAEEQRKKRAQHRAQLKQLKAQAAAAAAAATAKAAAAKAAAAAALKNPAHWEAVDPKHGNKHLALLTEEKHGAELMQVRWWARPQSGIERIVSVHRIQNSSLHQRFETARHQTPSLTEWVAFHGTAGNPPSLIYDSPTGFNMRCGAIHRGYLWFAQSYSGRGFFHPVAQATLPFGVGKLADRLRSQFGWGKTPAFKQILRVRLLLNDVEIAQLNGGIVVVNQSERCLPEYLITFQ